MGPNVGISAVRWTLNELVVWLNSALQLDGGDARSAPLASLQEAVTGCYHAQILDALLPGAVRMEIVVWGKHGRLLEHEITNNYKVVVTALQVAGVGYLVDFNASVKGRPVATVEFMQWLKNTADDTSFADIRDYDARGRRALCRSPTRDGPSKAPRFGGRRWRMSPGATLPPDAATSVRIGDGSVRCGTVFDEDDAVPFVVGQGSSERTLRARRSPLVSQFDEYDNGRRRFTGSVTISHPEGQLAYVPPERWGWPQQEDRRSSLDAPETLATHRHRRLSRTRRQEVEYSGSDYGDGDEMNWGRLKNDGTRKPNSWEEEFVVSHPPAPVGCVLCVEVKPGGDGQRIEGPADRDVMGDFGDGQVEINQATRKEGFKVCTSVIKVFFSVIKDTGYERRGNNRSKLSSVSTEEVALPGDMSSFGVEYGRGRRFGAEDILLQRKRGRPTPRSNAFERRIESTVEGRVRNGRTIEGNREKRAWNVRRANAPIDHEGHELCRKFRPAPPSCHPQRKRHRGSDDIAAHASSSSGGFRQHVRARLSEENRHAAVVRPRARGNLSRVRLEQMKKPEVGGTQDMPWPRTDRKVIAEPSERPARTHTKVASARRGRESPGCRALDAQPPANRRGQAARRVPNKGSRPGDNAVCSNPEVEETRDVACGNSSREGPGDDKENDRGSANRAVGKRADAAAATAAGTHAAHRRKKGDQSYPPFNDFSPPSTTRPPRKSPTRPSRGDSRGGEVRKHPETPSQPQKQPPRTVPVARIKSPTTNRSAGNRANGSAEKTESGDQQQSEDGGNGKDPDNEKLPSTRSEKVEEESTKSAHDDGDQDDTARSDASHAKTIATVDEEVEEVLTTAATNDQNAPGSVYCPSCGRKFGGEALAQKHIASCPSRVETKNAKKQKIQARLLQEADARRKAEFVKLPASNSANKVATKHIIQAGLLREANARRTPRRSEGPSAHKADAKKTATNENETAQASPSQEDKAVEIRAPEEVSPEASDASEKAATKAKVQASLLQEAATRRKLPGVDDKEASASGDKPKTVVKKTKQAVAARNKPGKEVDASTTPGSVGRGSSTAREAGEKKATAEDTPSESLEEELAVAARKNTAGSANPVIVPEEEETGDVLAQETAATATVTAAKKTKKSERLIVGGKEEEGDDAAGDEGMSGDPSSTTLAQTEADGGGGGGKARTGQKLFKKKKS